MRRVLFIAPGYLPYTFSENLCNGKLVYALTEAGFEVDVISKVDEGPAYDKEWNDPWTRLKKNCYEVKYENGHKIERVYDFIKCSLEMSLNPINGIRWAERAYRKALDLHKERHYDAILTRSPNDIPHIVGYKFAKNTGVKWIANWNDPASTIWPEPYTHHFGAWQVAVNNRYIKMCLKRADVNTFPSDSLRQHYISHFPFLKNKHTEVIPHIALADSIVIPKHEPEKEIFTMCHSGNMSVERDPGLMFQAMCRLIDKGYKDIRLDIMGHANQFVEDLVTKCHLQDYVKFIGGYPYLEAVSLLQKYSVLVLLEAKLEKGIFFPSKFTDYAQVHRPILAVSPLNGFAKDTIEQYGGGIAVNNENVDDIEQGILRFYQEWKGEALHSTYSTDRLYDSFSANTVVNQYKKIME